MASKSHDLTHGPLVQQIILFSLPLMATNVLQVLFNMSDVAVVGQFAGPEALGSVGSTSILVSLFTGFLIGMGSGVNVVVARYIGARHDQDVHEAVHTSLILSLIVGVIIMALGFLFTPAMLSMLGTKPVLMAGAVSYLRIYCLGMPAMARQRGAFRRRRHEKAALLPLDGGRHQHPAEPVLRHRLPFGGGGCGAGKHHLPVYFGGAGDFVPAPFGERGAAGTVNAAD